MTTEPKNKPAKTPRTRKTQALRITHWPVAVYRVRCPVKYRPSVDAYVYEEFYSTLPEPDSARRWHVLNQDSILLVVYDKAFKLDQASVTLEEIPTGTPLGKLDPALLGWEATGPGEGFTRLSKALAPWPPPKGGYGHVGAVLEGRRT